MSNSIKISTCLFLLFSTFFVACEKEGEQVVSTSGNSGVLTTSATAVTIDKATLNDNKITFTITPSDFGYQAGVTYSLEFGLKGTNFTPRKEIVLANTVMTHSFKGLDFNNLMLGLGLPLDADSELEVRQKSALSSSIAIYSNVATVTSRPIPLTAWIYVPGAYQGWNPVTADSLVSPTGDGIYSGVVVFTANNYEFKITPLKKWDVSYGDGGNGTVNLTGGGNFTSIDAGAKLLTYDLNALTYTIENAPVWSLIGDVVAGGVDWTSDADLKFINDAQGNYTATMDLIPGEFKFRRNKDWGVSLGGADGKLSSSGANLKITEAGNYTIRINPVALDYTLTKH